MVTGYQQQESVMRAGVRTDFMFIDLQGKEELCGKQNILSKTSRQEKEQKQSEGNKQ